MITPPALPYPAAPHDDVVDDYHGQAIPDPYRWLEDLDSPQTREWIAQQNALTESALARIPRRDAIRARLRAVWDYTRMSTPSRDGANYAFLRNSGLQNQAVLYVTPDLAAEPRALIDPNGLSDDGTIALAGLSFSPDGTKLAYALSISGSDWLEWHVRDVDTGVDLPDTVRYGKFSGAAWLPDGSGFLYSRYDSPVAGDLKTANYFHKTYVHRLGTDQAEDLLVFDCPDHPDWNISPTVSDDGRWCIFDVTRGTDPSNRIFAQDLQAPGSPVRGILVDGDARYEFLGNDATRLYFCTTLDAPRGRIIAHDVAGGESVELVPQGPDAIDAVALFGDRFYVQYLRDAHSVLVVYELDGRLVGDVALPGLGTIGHLEGKRGDARAFYSFTSYTQPATVYELDLATLTSRVIFAPAVDFDPALYCSEQVFARSADGTRVPLIITRRRDVALDGTAPTILYGYGGFNISLTPAFSPATLVWLELGGIYAVANLRGGGEYGEAWHAAGRGRFKQNVFDDCIAAAEHLIAQNYTCSARLAVAGGSNGGLLVGAMITQRPDLFGAALPSVGVFDMLRFPKFTIGWAWTSDFGSPDDPDEFAWLLAYSPLHNLRPGVSYPPTFITTADHDDRVFPAHSFKFAARLQETQGGDAPVLIRIESKAGHGAGKPTSKIIEEHADRYAFLTDVLHIF